MSDSILLNAKLREKTGRNASRRLRLAGYLPAVIYGGGKPELPVTLNANDTGKALNVEQFHTTILTIAIADKKDEEHVLLKEVQWDPIKDTPIHLDFFRVKGSDTVEIEIPVLAINFEKAPGVIEGGKIDMIRHVLQVSCRADAIPEHVKIDCSQLNLGDTVHVEDVTLPEGVTAPHEVNFTILNLSTVKGVKTDEETEEQTEEEEAEKES
ncbi:MAG: 50S ribosomal protein L25/general stress protein Ctc [Mariprofundaceae bacterium]|nr:50S ribosomal protein L25/general stress protein Ctc [Mariprofundaceae bacterium]